MNSAQFECPDCAERPIAADYVEQRDLAIVKTAECEKLKAEHDELAAQVGEMREALSDARLSLYGTPYHLTCVDEALALPDISTSILNRVRAEMVERCAKVCDELASGYHRTAQGNYDGMYDHMESAAEECATDIRALAADMEAGK